MRGNLYTLKKDNLPAFEHMLGFFYGTEALEEYGSHNSRTRDIQILTNIKEESLRILNKLVDLEVPIDSISINTARFEVEFGVSGMQLHTTGSYGATPGIYVYFNHNQYNYPGAIDRLLKLLSTVKHNIKQVSDNSIRKWLKGEVKINEEEWLKMIKIQSLQNSLK